MYCKLAQYIVTLITVSLLGTKQYQVSNKFTGFFLTVQSADALYGNDREGRHTNVGTFHPMLGDALTQISETCPNAVTQTSSIYKSEIQVYWKAPPSGSGCVVFRSVLSIYSEEYSYSTIKNHPSSFF